MKHKLGFVFMMGLTALSSGLSYASDIDAQAKGETVENWVAGAGLMTTTTVGPMSALVINARYSSRAKSLKSQIKKNNQMAKGQDFATKRELSLKNEQLEGALERDFKKTGRKVMGILGGSYVLGPVLAGPVAEWSGRQVTERIEKARAESQPDFGKAPSSQGTANSSAQ